MHCLNPSNRGLPRLLSFLALSLCILASPALAGGKKGGMRISFHIEGEETDGPNRVRAFEVNGEQKFFEIIPVVTHDNFVAYYPFNAKGGTFGAAFQLNERGRTALSRAAIGKNLGKMIMPFVNGQEGEPMIIDRAQGQFIVLWAGLAQEHFDIFEKKWKLRAINRPEDLPR